MPHRLSPAMRQHRNDRIREEWGPRGAAQRLAEEFSTSVGAIKRDAAALGLKSHSRRAPVILGRRHPTIAAKRTNFPSTVVTSAETPRVLAHRLQGGKLGQRVSTGRWRGLKIYSVTLEERATCPSTCPEFRSCYGNNMPLARRHRLDRHLMARIDEEVADLTAKRGRGILVRLHQLGDFGQPENPELALEYVACWRSLLHDHRKLHVFGYTAHPPTSRIGRAIDALNDDFPDQCRIRFSGHRIGGGRGAFVIERGEQPGKGAFVCLVENEKAKNCADCALCWQAAGDVAFWRH